MPMMETSAAILALVAVGAYLLGSVPFGIVITRALGLGDLRKIGSGNIGATNVLRTGNKGAALATLVLDAGKGGIAVALARLVGGPDAALLAALASFLGHLFPVWLGFKGGKGVATAAGILFAISWVLGLATLGTWLIVAFFMRYSSLAALCAAVFAPLYFSFLFGVQPMSFAILIMSLFLIYRHRSNIRNLMNGTETRLAKRK